MEPVQESITFVVRVRPGERGRVSGIVHRVKTGEKHRFQEADAIGVLIAEMVRHELEGPAGEERARGVSRPGCRGRRDAGRSP
jgi:hypothetical protein